MSNLLALSAVVAYLLAFFYLYILVMGIYRAHLAKRLTGITLVLCFPMVVVGYLVDVMSNIGIASLVFLELPKEWLVTTRLTRYIAEDTGWRHHVAQWICDDLLDPFDPSGDHC